MTPEFWAITGVGVSLLVFGLAAIQFAFKRMDQRFDEVSRRMDQRFDEVSRRMDQRFDEMNRRMDQRFDEVNRRMDRLEARMDRIEIRMDRLEARVTELEKGQAAMGGLLNGLREALFARSREGAGSSSG